MSIKEAMDILQLSNLPSKEINLSKVKKNYKQLIFKYHPDRNMDLTTEELKEAEELTKLINFAYECLTEHFMNYNDVDYMNIDSDLYNSICDFKDFISRYKNCGVHEIEECANEIMQSLNINSIKSYDELEKARITFDTKIYEILVGYERYYRVIHGIPFVFCEGEVDYSGDIDEYLYSLENLLLERQSYKDEKLEEIASNYYIIDELKTNKVFKEKLKAISSKLDKYNVDINKEKIIFEEYNDLYSEIHYKYSLVSKKFNKLVKKIKNVPYFYKFYDQNYKLFIDRLVQGIFDDSFDKEYNEISDIIDMYNEKQIICSKIFNLLNKKHNLAKKNGDLYDFEKERMIKDCIFKILNDYKKGTVDLDKLKLLNNITFSNIAIDEYIISCFNSNDLDYDIYVTINKEDNSDLKFIMKNKEIEDEFLVIEDNDLVKIDALSLKNDYYIMSLDYFLNKVNIINEYIDDTKKVMLEYGNFYLVRERKGKYVVCYKDTISIPKTEVNRNKRKFNMIEVKTKITHDTKRTYNNCVNSNNGFFQKLIRKF